MDYQDSIRGDIQYNDYAGYFDNMESDQPLRIQQNVKLFKSLQQMIDDYFSISTQQEMEQLKKDELILEMASTMEQIYINSSQPHLVETIASSLCLILNKKDKITSPSHIYAVLEKKYKNRYCSEVGRSKRGDIFSRRNVRFNDFRESIAKIMNFFYDTPNIDIDKQQEFTLLLNRFDEAKDRVMNEIQEMRDDSRDGTPEENDNNNSSNEDGDNDNDDQEYEDSSNNNTPEKFRSKYYNRLGLYIQLLQKLQQNVLQYPPSRDLDEKLDRSLALEMEILMPSIDMKFKRSIAQLDETIQYADSQSLNGASSVMHETALVKDFRGSVADPNNTYNKFLEITHKLTPEQIDTRRPYISIIRKRMQKYQPHLFYHLIWYEGSKRLGHNLSMSKFARSNLLRKKIAN